jgi:hypothetical protein
MRCAILRSDGAHQPAFAKRSLGLGRLLAIVGLA